MKILLFVNTKQNFKNIKNLGGVEILNFNLFNFLKIKNEVTITNKISNKIKKEKWDIVLSSNDAKVFNKIKTTRKILWLHNRLQIEKAIRKKQFFSLIKNRIEAVFVSKYLNEHTSLFYNFKKRIIIPNFLTNDFDKINIKKNNSLKKPYFVWSVQRNKGLDEVVNMWVKDIYPKNAKAQLHIFGIKNNKYNNLKQKNIFNHGRVNRNTLITYYKKSTAMICLGYDETFCLNAIESMATGLPIITLGETALGEIIIDKYNGYKINSINDLGHIINKIIKLDKKKLKRLNINCINFSKNFKFSLIKNKWNSLLHQ